MEFYKFRSFKFVGRITLIPPEHSSTNKGLWEQLLNLLICWYFLDLFGMSWQNEAIQLTVLGPRTQGCLNRARDASSWGPVRNASWRNSTGALGDSHRLFEPKFYLQIVQNYREASLSSIGYRTLQNYKKSATSHLFLVSRVSWHSIKLYVKLYLNLFIYITYITHTITYCVIIVSS